MDFFDPEDLTQRMHSVPEPNCAMFAWSCTNRIEPYFRRYAEQEGVLAPGLIRSMLENVAGCWIAGGIQSESILADFEALEKLIPEEEPHQYKRGQMIFEDAIICAFYTVQSALEENREPAVWAGTRLYDIADRVVVNASDLDLNDDGAAKRILTDPVVVTELSRQRRDLSDLARHLSEDLKAGFVSLRRHETLIEERDIPY